MLCEFVTEEVKRGNHDESIIEIILYLIETKNNGRNSVNNSEIKNIFNKDTQSTSRLQSKKFECILNLLKNEYLLYK